MFLEKIEIQGFKSFGTRTTIEFPKINDQQTHGVTVIVGPNGSGKSNIIDALRWVMGEQSAKSLRGAKNKDVIFSGSHTKSRLGMAEVTLHFNNEDKKTPIDYTNLAITRRIFRDGDSEYIINNQSARLHDILILLARCNIGQKSYSIIGQGMITKIINATPTERKEFFDEATGIRHHQIKRDHAYNKLLRTGDNLEISQQLLNELTPRLNSLKRQSAKLEQRKQIEAELLEKQKTYYGIIWKTIDMQLDTTITESGFHEDKKHRFEENIRLLNYKLEEIGRQKSRSEIFNELQKTYSELTFDKNRFTQELAIIKGKTNLEYNLQGRQNLSWLELKEDELRHKFTQIENEKSKFQEIKKNLTTELEKLNIEITKNENRLNDIEKTLFDSHKNQKITDFSHQNSHVKTLLLEQKSIHGMIGLLCELATAQPAYAKALEVVAGKYMEALVTTDEHAAHQCIDFLKQHRLGTATFLPLNKIKPTHNSTDINGILKITGVIDYAIRLLSFETKFHSIFSFVFGSTLVVDHLETAKRIGIGSMRMVTLDGDLLEKSGVMRGGFRRYSTIYTFGATTKTNLKDNLEELERERIKIIEEKKHLQQTQAELTIKIETNHSEIFIGTQTIATIKKELAMITEEKSHIGVSPEQADSILKTLLSQRDDLEKKIESMDEEIQKQKMEIDLFNEREEQKKQKLLSLQQQIHAKQDELNIISETVNRFSIEIARLKTKRQDLQIEIKEEIKQDPNELQKISEDQKLDIPIIFESIKNLKQKLSIIGGIDPEIIKELNEVKERHEFLNDQISDLSKALTDTKKIVKGLDEIIAKQFESSFKKINKEFQHFFEKLFGGGRAKLELILRQTPDESEAAETEEAKPINEQSVASGIEIMASPSHKKITHLAMMSGGEKTMTAIALICAIISVNPSPFVFLDEVDAALDESNSHKLADIFKELSHVTQFIIITHNRVIMHIADILYGVAMNADGITKLISLNIAEAEKMDR